MRKYMKKSKITADVAVMEVPPQPSNGVRTRAAKTLALQRLQRPSHSSGPLSRPDIFSSSCLELRSRRLQKLPLRKQQQEQLLLQRKTEQSSGCCRQRVKRSNFRLSSKLRSNSLESESVSIGDEKEEEEVGFDIQVEDNLNLSSIKSSSIHSNLEFDEGNRSFPTSYEIEEFFAYAERKEQRVFIEKYNFDIINDVPLSGRYEWVELE